MGSKREKSEQEQLKLESESELRDIFEQAALGMCFTSASGDFLKVNKKFCSLVGYSKEEIQGMNFKEITYFEDLYLDLEYYRRLTSGDIETYDLDKRYVRKNGELLWINITVSVQRNEDFSVKYFIGIIIDISEKKEQEKALHDANEMLERRVEERTIELKKNEKILLEAKESAEEADRSKSVFIANMSHEFRTPLNAVIGFSEILYSQIEDVKYKNYLQSINNAGKSLLNLINDMLDLSKIEAGMIELKLVPINLKRLIDEINSIYKIQAQIKKLDFIIEIEKDMPEFLLLDEIRLRQVLLNIIGNAVKFTDSGYIKTSIKKEIYNGNKESKIDLMVSVEDTGIGIEEGKLTSIFQSFNQQYGKDNRRYGGTGLGLSISRKLVEMMNGELKVESEFGSGSKFSFVLKGVNTIRSTYNTDITEASKENSMCFEKTKVLIVDDVELNRYLLKEILEITDIEALTAKNGLEAIEISNSELPKLILMDVLMPEMNGIETAEAIKNNPRTSKIPIVALTAMDDIEELKDANIKCFDGIAYKPINRVKLFSELSKFIPMGICKTKDIDTKKDVVTEKLEFSSDLKTKFELEIFPYIEKLKIGVRSNDAKDFSILLVSIGIDYGVEFIEKIGFRLKEAVECFDIVEINGCVYQLEKWFIDQKLKGCEKNE